MLIVATNNLPDNSGATNTLPKVEKNPRRWGQRLKWWLTIIFSIIWFVLFVMIIIWSFQDDEPNNSNEVYITENAACDRPGAPDKKLVENVTPSVQHTRILPGDNDTEVSSGLDNKLNRLPLGNHNVQNNSDGNVSPDTNIAMGQPTGNNGNNIVDDWWPKDTSENAKVNDIANSSNNIPPAPSGLTKVTANGNVPPAPVVPVNVLKPLIVLTTVIPKMTNAEKITFSKYQELWTAYFRNPAMQIPAISRSDMGIINQVSPQHQRTNADQLTTPETEALAKLTEQDKEIMVLDPTTLSQEQLEMLRDLYNRSEEVGIKLPKLHTRILASSAKQGETVKDQPTPLLTGQLKKEIMDFDWKKLKPIPPKGETEPLPLTTWEQLRKAVENFSRGDLKSIQKTEKKKDEAPAKKDVGAQPDPFKSTDPSLKEAVKQRYTKLNENNHKHETTDESEWSDLGY